MRRVPCSTHSSKTSVSVETPPPKPPAPSAASTPRHDSDTSSGRDATSAPSAPKARCSWRSTAAPHHAMLCTLGGEVRTWARRPRSAALARRGAASGGDARSRTHARTHARACPPARARRARAARNSLTCNAQLRDTYNLHVQPQKGCAGKVTRAHCCTPPPALRVSKAP